jgi:hypothetical protein
MHKDAPLGLYFRSESETDDSREGESVICCILQRETTKFYYPHFHSALLQVTVTSFENISPAVPSPRIVTFLPQQANSVSSLSFDALFIFQ